MLAIDIGASSGRAVVGTFDGERLAVEETARFPNELVDLGGRLVWDVPRLVGDVRTAIADVAAPALDSVALDTWGVDFALVDAAGELVTLPRSYRDDGTLETIAAVEAARPDIDPYGATGVQTMRINTLFQLWALRARSPWALEAADRLLMMPDLLALALTGQATNELTMASTTQLLDPRTRDWAWPLIDELGFPRRLFRPPVEPGIDIGSLDGITGGPRLVTSASHDTSAAVVGAPAVRADTAVVSSGSWCLVATEEAGPVVTDATRAANLSNELGAGGRTTLLRNVVGLWLVEESRRHWARSGRALDHARLIADAEREPAAAHLFDPDEPTLLAPGDLPGRIARAVGADGPLEPPVIVRAIADSIALKVRRTLEHLEAAVGRPIGRISLVGGGVRDRLHCQVLADATGRPVVAGPAEATAVGNILVQLIGRGELAGLDEAREVVARTFATVTYEPSDGARWEDAYGAFVARLER